MERGSTLLMPGAAAMHDPATSPVYGIEGLAAQKALREVLAELERASAVFLAPTGLAAITLAMLAVCRTGDDVLAVDCLYSPTRRFCDRMLARFGVGVRYVGGRTSPEEILAAAGERTRLIVMESPGSLTFEIQDVAAIAAAARARGILTMVDNSWAAGLAFKPLEHGADLSVQALTKYAGGHSDLFLGSVAVRDEELAVRLQETVDDVGVYASPDDAWLALRGLRTLAVRMAQHAKSGLQVAEWLQQRPEVERVLYPPLPSSPDHALWTRDFSGAAGLMGVVLGPGSPEAVRAMLDRLELFGLGFSWGGFESLATYETPQLARRRSGKAFEGPLIRLHVGLEAVEDLTADLAQALDGYPGRL